MRPAILLALIVGSAFAQDPLPASKGSVDPKSGHVFFDVRQLTVEGQGWTDLKSPFDRLPAKADGKVPAAVWNLSRHSAGIAVRFVTDAPAVHLRWSLTAAKLEMPHMPATGVSGIDLYYRANKDGRWQWAGVAFPSTQDNNSASIVVPAGKKECMIYLPLYNGCKSVEVGVPKDAFLAKAVARPEAHAKPIVFYGTSITHGACASRPGMVHTAILGRRFERPVINLGFSGNGRMDPAVVELLAELDPAVYVIDCLPNMQAKDVEERTVPLVRALRKTRPTTPILLVEDRNYTNSPANEALRKRNESSQAALRKEFAKLTGDKVAHVHYLRGDRLLGDDGEGAVDGSHPSDLGFMRQADAFAEALGPMLPQPNERRARVEAYTDQLSYVPGEEVKFHVSSADKAFDVQITRIGGELQTVWKKEGIAGSLQPIPSDASSRGCGWAETFRVEIPAEWKSGYYVARFVPTGVGAKGNASEAFFVVRSASPGKDTKILLQLSTNTYNAYTNWGGFSLYAYHGRHGIQGRRVSFNRPQFSQFDSWEKPFVQWAEKAGYTIDYAANSDLEFHPEILKHYKLVLSVGHDEYWSAPMRDNLEKFIRDGGHVAFFSGNTCCWQVRSEEGGRALACWKQSYRDDPLYPNGNMKLLSSLWSHHLVKRPENELTGVGFLHGGYHRSHGQFMDDKAEFTVHRPDHWLFEGTKLKRGDVFGSKDTIVGYECDGCELTWKDGLPIPTFRDGTPKNFVILATCPAKWHPDDCEWYERWARGRVGNAVVGSYTNGGTVVTVGTTDWSHGLRGNDPAVVRITRNVLERLGR